MKICEIINLELIEQQVIFIQGYKSEKAILKNFGKRTKIREFMVDALSDYQALSATTNGWVTTIKEDGLMLPILFLSRPLDVNNTKSLGVLAHELIHVLQEIKKKFFPGTGEIEFDAYLYQFLFEKIITLVKDKAHG
jgi:hypothetical protein